MPFLASLEFGHDLSVLLKKLKVGERMLADCIQALYDLSRESALIFVGAEVERKFHGRFGIAAISKSARYKRLVPGPRVLREQAGLVRLEKSLGFWSTTNLERLIRAARKRFEDLSAAEDEIVGLTRRALNRGCSSSDAAWIAALILASRTG